MFGSHNIYLVRLFCVFPCFLRWVATTALRPLRRLFTRRFSFKARTCLQASDRVESLLIQRSMRVARGVCVCVRTTVVLIILLTSSVNVDYQVR